MSLETNEQEIELNGGQKCLLVPEKGMFLVCIQSDTTKNMASMGDQEHTAGKAEGEGIMVLFGSNSREEVQQDAETDLVPISIVPPRSSSKLVI